MMKQFRKLTSIFVAAMMLISVYAPAAQAKAPETIDVVTLGDSVAYGMSTLNGGYNDLLKGALERANPESKIKYKNLSAPGDTTEDLLRVIKVNPGVLKQADIITINIGGNNILSPTINALKVAFGLPEDATLEQMNEAVENFPGDLSTIVTGLLSSTTLMSGLNTGVSDFGEHWPLMIEQIRELAPEAEIYVNTIYNPLYLMGFLGAPYSDLNSYLTNYCFGPMNGLIAANSDSESSYRVIGVYATFSNLMPPYSPLNFNIYDDSVTPYNLDIHPNDFGHSLIFSALSDEMRAYSEYLI